MIKTCSFCTNTVTQAEANSSNGLYGKPVCFSVDCTNKANVEAQQATDKLLSSRDKVLKYLAGHDFREQSMTKGLFIIEDGSNIVADLRGIEPKIGVLINSVLQEEGHGISRIQDIRAEIAGILKSKPAPKAKELPVPVAKIVACRTCGIELSVEERKANAPEVKSEPKIPEVVAPEKTVMAPVGTLEGNRQRNLPKPEIIIPARVTSPQGNYIKGLVPTMKEIGKIKIGSKGETKTTQKGTQYRPPVKFDHFEVVSVLRNEHGNLIPDPVMKELGENPKELDIFLIYNDETLNFTTRYNEYKGGKCLCSGDGVEARTIDGGKKECNPDTCQSFKDKKCKPNGILNVILMKSPRLGGVYKFRTTSYNSIRSILSSLFFLKSLTGGVLAMIPLKLTVSPMTVQPKDSAAAQTIYVVNVEFAGTVQQLLEKTVEVSKYQSMMRGNIRQLEVTARVALNAPESEADIKETEAEFYPVKPEETKA